MHGQNCNYLKIYVPKTDKKRRPVRPHCGVRSLQVEKATCVCRYMLSLPRFVRTTITSRLISRGRKCEVEIETIIKSTNLTITQIMNYN